MGIETSFVDMTDLAKLEKEFKSNTAVNTFKWTYNKDLCNIASHQNLNC